MKKVYIFFLLAAIIISCNKKESITPAPDPVPIIEETFIKFSSVNPVSGTTITTATEIKVSGEYNISTNELEGLGFQLKYWTSVDNSYATLYKQATVLTKRKNNFTMTFPITDDIIKQVKGKNIKFYATLARENGVLDITMVRTEQINYQIE